MPAQTRGKQYKHRVKLVMPVQAQLNGACDRVIKSMMFKQALRRLKRSRTEIDYAYEKSKRYARATNSVNGVKRSKCRIHHYSTRVPFKWEIDELYEPKRLTWSKRELCVVINQNKAHLIKATVTRVIETDSVTRYELRADGLSRMYAVEPCLDALNNRELAQAVLNYPELRVYKVI